MAIGAAVKQGQFEDAALVLGDRLKAGSLYRLLADEGHRLFPDSYFADLFVATPRGRPTIPARTVATVMLLPELRGACRTAKPVTAWPSTCAGRRQPG
jgi:hypothetical protein